MKSAAVLVFAAALLHAQPLLSPEDQRFWYERARQVAASATLKSGASSGKYRNSTPYDVHVPGGNMGYPAFWVRDAVMMLGGDFISAAELEGWIRLMSSAIRGPKDWQVRPGVVVPAYAVPDHINFDGKPTFYPGSLETGEKQGGNPWGKYPPLDDHFYFIGAVYEHWKLTGRVLRVETSFNEMNLPDLCERVYRVAPSDPDGLVTAGDIHTENAKDFGFCDAESKSGKLLFPSILKYVAAKQLAELLPHKASAYVEDATRIRLAIVKTFFRDGWLRSATGIGNQPDVWGSAFAVWSGAVDETTARRLGHSLLRAFRERTAVREGCVRQLLAGQGWQVSVSEVGEYQNGGYWGTPTGWYIAALAKVDRAAAAEMAREFVVFLRDHPETWEWFNPDTGRNANPQYVATVALPYLSLKGAGLIP